MLITRIMALAVGVAGVVLVSNLELVSSKPVPEDTFEAIERRVWWGLLVGLAALLWFHRQIKPWLHTVVATGAAFTFGLLSARLIGIALDGSAAQQWFWVAVEAVILCGLLYWYTKQRGPNV